MFWFMSAAHCWKIGQDGFKLDVAFSDLHYRLFPLNFISSFPIFPYFSHVALLSLFLTSKCFLFISFMLILYLFIRTQSYSNRVGNRLRFILQNAKTGPVNCQCFFIFLPWWLYVHTWLWQPSCVFLSDENWLISFISV